jgi:hypothetical protein
MYVGYSGSWVISIKQNTNFNFQPPSTFILGFQRKVLLKVVHHLKIYQHTVFHGPIFSDSSFVSTSEVRKFVILEWLKELDYNHRVEVTFNGMICLLNLIKTDQLVQQ